MVAMFSRKSQDIALFKNILYLFVDCYTPIFSLFMEFLSGYHRVTDTFLLVATKSPFDLGAVIGKSEKITISVLSNSLLTLPENERVEEMLVYEVRNK